MLGHFFHIMQNEMNVTNRFATNQKNPRIDPRPEKRSENHGGVETCGNATSDLMTAHLSKVFALHAELIAV